MDKGSGFKVQGPEFMVKRYHIGIMEKNMETTTLW